MKRPRRLTGEITLGPRPEPRLREITDKIVPIRVNTSEYEAAHRQAPRGYGSWAIWLGDRSGPIEQARWFTGTWTFAKAAGRAWARSMNATAITLGS